MGGSGSIIDALVRGIKRNGGRIMLRTHVEQILMENGKASGVKLRPRSGSNGPPEVITARCGVVSNASVWDTQKLLPGGAGPSEWRKRSQETPMVCARVPWALQVSV